MMRMFSGTLDISKEKPGFLVSVWQLNMVRAVGESHVDGKGGGGVAAAATRLFTYVQVSRGHRKKRVGKSINQIISFKKNQAAGCGGANLGQDGRVVECWGEVRAPSTGRCERRHYRSLATLGGRPRQRGDGAADV